MLPVCNEGCSRWNYYTDYGGPGNCIWLAWDDDFVDVDVVETGEQFVHCAVCIRSLHMHVLITVVYGVNDVIGRRVVWAELARLLPELVTYHGWVSVLPGITVVGLPEPVEEHHIVGTAMYAVTRKLKALKPIFRAQRRRKGDLSTNVSLAAGFLETAQHLLARDRHCPTLLHLEFCCKLVLRLASRLEQSMLQQRAKMAWLKDGDQCSRVFFRKELLDGRTRDRFIDLRYLRPWARHILTDEEAATLVVLVTPGEIKQALFDIDESKAPARMATRRHSSKPPSRGYNQQSLPPRCALRVDLRKAYDTVEWDFLRAALTLFGFPEQFIRWIVECVTTPSFSVCVNGAPHGFFKGARGLRQGDPMSPYLFVLVMEVLTLLLQQRIEQNGGFSYHWECEGVQLFQLGFVDDLLLFSKADPNSVRLFKEASRLSISDCQPLLQKIEDRIKNWEGVLLSFAGRVQIIKSVLSALQVYWAMAFILPKHVIKEIEKRLRNFLWKGSLEVGYAKVSWQHVCRLVGEGGLGIHDIHALNKGLMSRHLWRIIMQERSSIWVNWISHYRLRDCSVWTISTRSGTWGWRKLIRVRDSLRPCLRYRIGEALHSPCGTIPGMIRGLLFSSSPWDHGTPLSLHQLHLARSYWRIRGIGQISLTWRALTSLMTSLLSMGGGTVLFGPDR
ncbi:UNVERIFIED_CONTAM: Retrovirus-related Pol polyprotein from type-1 retrotransposable element R2 [Sesamum radiatum]|uniref:Retrovirus-related Pol polyprotein from type-1 retrotransposable element R2 n=1 Tax=Sesamum radiatum TaxID=300843 RepID=A0AAW2IYA7_SESRA